MEKLLNLTIWVEKMSIKNIKFKSVKKDHLEKHDWKSR